MGIDTKRVSVFDFTRRMIAQQYALGNLDCFRLSYDFIIENGIDLPDKIGKVTLKNYPNLFKKDPGKAIKTMMKFISKHLDEIPIYKAFAGDILLLKLKSAEGHPFLAIHGGNGNIISVTEKYGVRATPIKHYSVERVFRCRNFSH